MKVLKVEGTFDIPGRGRIFTADRHKHKFELLDLEKGEVLLIKNHKWIVNHTESFEHGQIVGVCVRRYNA